MTVMVSRYCAASGDPLGSHDFVSGVGAVVTYCRGCGVILNEPQPKSPNKKAAKPRIRQPSKFTRLAERDGGMFCAYCHRPVVRRQGPNDGRTNTVTVDHRTPTSRGGSNDDDNCCLACRPCNAGKGDMLEAEWREWLLETARTLLEVGG